MEIHGLLRLLKVVAAACRACAHPRAQYLALLVALPSHPPDGATSAQRRECSGLFRRVSPPAPGPYCCLCASHSLPLPHGAF